QNGYTLAMLVLTLALLLWTNYTGSIANASRANVKLTGDARWDFWESGLVAMAALIVLGIMLPPLSTADRTLDLESGVFSGWLQPPRNFQDVLFYPGELYHIDRSTTANQVLLRPGRPGPSPNPVPNPNTSLYTIDRLSSLQPPTSARNYAATVEYSTATVADLQNAGTSYSAWLNQ